MFNELERRMIYYPDKYPEGQWEPELFGVSVKDHYFNSTDGTRLHGWFAGSDVPGAQQILLWFHGNAGNITHRLDNIRLILNLNVHVFIFDYRGYGRSDGEPDEEGIYKDGLAAYDYLESEYSPGPDNIILFGRSLGTAVAVEIAAKREVSGIVLESPFTDAKDMAKVMFPYIPAGSLISSRFDNLGKIKKVNAPLLVIHGDTDEVVPIELGKKLYEVAPDPKQFYTIKGAGHNDTYLVGGERYFLVLKEFFDKLKK